jgi:hypothetical protein
MSTFRYLLFGQSHDIVFKDDINLTAGWAIKFPEFNVGYGENG